MEATLTFEGSGMWAQQTQRGDPDSLRLLFQISTKNMVVSNALRGMLYIILTA